MRSIEPGISRFRVWSFGPSRNDGVRNVDARDKPEQDELIELWLTKRPYALAISGNTASILVFSVAALNGLTM